jgi:hypothetical protein
LEKAGEMKPHADYRNLLAAMFHFLERFHLALRYVLVGMMVLRLWMLIQHLQQR